VHALVFFVLFVESELTVRPAAVYTKWPHIKQIQVDVGLYAKMDIMKKADCVLINLTLTSHDSKYRIDLETVTKLKRNNP
jgi:hypothetical protein